LNILKELPPKTAASVQIAAVILVSIAVYFSTLFNGFVIDDSFQILGNRWIRDVRYIPEIFSSDFVLGGKTPFYRPLVHVIYMVSYHLFGPAPLGFHLMSIAFHAGVSVLVFLVILHLLRTRRPAGDSSPPAFERNEKRSRWISFAAALLFATHPVHTEAVAWISVTDIYMTFFLLLSFYLYIRSSERGASSAAAYVLSAVSFFLAMLCKEPALSLPVILVAYDYVYRKERAGLSPYWRYLPYLIAAGAYFGLRLRALGGMVTFKTPLNLSSAEYVIDILALFREYIGKLLLPVNLNVWHVFHPPAALFSFAGMTALLVTAGFLLVAVITIRKNRVALLGFLFIVVPLMPALYLPALTQGLENAFTERYLYLPSVGFVLLAALVIAFVHDRKRGWTPAVIAIVSTVVVLYTLRTMTRIPDWRDSYTLWTDVAKKSPESAVACNGLAAALMEKGRHDDAIEEYLIALRLAPGNPYTHADLGLAYSAKGWADKAVEELQTALSLRPESAEVHDMLGVIYESLGRHHEAVKEFEIAVLLNPQLVDIYKHLGIAYSNLGMTDKAVAYFQTALQRDPDDADTHNNLGVVYAQRRAMELAVSHFEAAARLNPADPAPHYNAAGAYTALGRADKAEEHMRAAQHLQGEKP
jgi:tetratricopeptide (TPR) repeat protein